MKTVNQLKSVSEILNDIAGRFEGQGQMPDRLAHRIDRIGEALDAIVNELETL